MLRKYMLIAVATGMFAATIAAPAQARDGCGPGAHRNPWGRCRPNGPPRGGPGMVVGVPGGPGLVVGNFYEGRGYWDGRRYYQHRERHHGDWRYR